MEVVDDPATITDAIGVDFKRSLNWVYISTVFKFSSTLHRVIGLVFSVSFSAHSVHIIPSSSDE